MVAVFAGSGTRAIIGIAIAAAGAVLAIVAGYVSWQYTTYFVRGGALHFRSGVFSPDETSIPLGRIQAIDESQGPIQRLFGVQELNVQTAGGGAKGEIVLRAVSEEAARGLRAAAGLPEPVERDLPEWRLGMGALAVTAITAPQLSVLLPIVGAIGAGADDIFFPNDDGSGLIDALPRDAGGIEVLLGLLFLGALLLSFLGAIVTFSGFTLVRDGERLRIRRGLFARRAATIPLSRVHAVDVVEGVLRRPFGLCTVRVQTAGYAKERAAAQTLLPLVRVSDVQRLLDVFVPAAGGRGAGAGAAARARPPPLRPSARRGGCGRRGRRDDRGVHRLAGDPGARRDRRGHRADALACSGLELGRPPLPRPRRRARAADAGRHGRTGSRSIS